MASSKSALDRAQEILRISPLPADARQRLDDLEKEAGPDEKIFFGSLREALFVAESAEAQRAEGK